MLKASAIEALRGLSDDAFTLIVSMVGLYDNREHIFFLVARELGVRPMDGFNDARLSEIYELSQSSCIALVEVLRLCQHDLSKVTKDELMDFILSF